MSEEGPPDTPKSVSRSSFAFLSGTFLSRLSGVGRDTALAIVFGSNPAIAAFMVAFRFSNLIRRLFGEGPMASGFIPHFEQLRSSSPKQGALFFRDLFFSLTLFLILLIGGIEGVLWSIWKWGGLQPDNAEIVYLTALMLPGILFICLFGLSTALLQCERKFFVTGVAPVAFNLVWVAATLFLKGREAAYAMAFLSVAVIAAFFLQWAMLAPQTFAQIKRFLTWKECFTPQLFSEKMRRLVKPLALSIIGVAAVQINTALDAVFARYASLEGPAYLWYAIRIQQLPLALFGIALSSALLPPLARALKDGAYDHYLKLLKFALRRSFSLIFPCTLGIFVLGIAGINLLYGHGAFDSESTYHTALCLWGYGIGLLPAVFVLILAPAFYASKDFRTPMLGSVSTVVANILLNALFVFVFQWGAFSIAVATSLAAWCNFFYLSQRLAQKMGQPLWDATLLSSFLKTAACTMIAALGTLFVGHFLVDDPTLVILSGQSSVVFERELTTQLMQGAALCGAFLLLFFSYAWLLNAQDVLELIGVRRTAPQTSS